MQTHSLKEFSELGITDDILSSIRLAGFTSPTSIQKLAVPKILSGADFIIEAQTGSGKTASFAWPILQKLSAEEKTPVKNIKALVLSPTRELALQTSGAFYRFGEFLTNKISVLTVIGGESILQQTNTLLAGVDIVVATPGRLLDLINQKALDLSFIEFLVIDEADKILDLGFAAELESLLENIKSERQNLFFSATYPDKVLEIVKKITTTPIHLKIEGDLPVVQNIIQRAILVNRENRGLLLRSLIKTEKWRNALVFVGSKVSARNLAIKLKKMGVNAGAIHGDLSQSERNKALSDFKNNKLDFLIATDVAARGIDIIKLSLVINFDLPRSPADYIHRIGRTGRADEKGLTIALVKHTEWNLMSGIERFLKQNFKRRNINELVGSYQGPKKLKSSGKAAGSKQKAEVKKPAAEKVKIRHRNQKNIGKRRMPTIKPGSDS
jgi:superfamily II DNA/RNA helicase